MGARKESSAGGRSASRTAADLAVLGIAAFALLGPRASLRGWWRERAERIDVERTIASAWGDLNGEGGRLGSAGSGRVLVEFGDYECPFCRSSHETTAELLARRPDLTLVYRHLPLTAIHPSAEAAARASICAERAGRFQAMHDFLYETEEWRKGVDWADVAREVGVANIETFEACLESVETDEPGRAREGSAGWCVGKDRPVVEDRPRKGLGRGVSSERTEARDDGQGAEKDPRGQRRGDPGRGVGDGGRGGAGGGGGERLRSVPYPVSARRPGVLSGHGVCGGRRLRPHVRA